MVCVLNKYITTFSKIHFAPTEPKAEDIKVEDIAHALSLLCGANGHFKRFFSFAQHSINCAAEAAARGYSEKIQLACLLCDASEAYLSNIFMPVRPYFPEYLSYVKKLQTMIYSEFLDDELTEQELKQICEIEDAMLYHEFIEFMDEKIDKIEPLLIAKPKFGTMDCKVIERQFLNTYNLLAQSIASPSCINSNYLCVGIDSCMEKWIVVAITKIGFEVNLIDSIGDVCKKYGNADSIILAAPIGLPENLDEIRPNSELRKRLKGKTSTVFNTPCRQAVYAADYTKAVEENKKALNVSISPLSNTSLPKIREIDRFLNENPEWKNRLVESHPEFCFSVMNHIAPIRENKQTLLGVNRRIEVLSQYYPESCSVVEQFQRTTSFRLSSKMDDLIDALALAVMGVLGIENGFFTIPETPMEDSRGIKMQIVAANIE
jgi:predicted RNase H-like nuclease